MTVVNGPGLSRTTAQLSAHIHFRRAYDIFFIVSPVW